MKKFLCILVVINMMLGMLGYVQAADESTGSKITCNLNSAPIVINNKAVNIRTITYQNKVYVPLAEISSYLNADTSMDDKNKTANVLLGKKPTKTYNFKDKQTKKLKQSIDAGVNQYKILIDGVNEHMESILYGKTLYVPIRSFAEVFDKSIQSLKDGRISVNDRTDTVSVVNGEKIAKWEFEYYYNPEAGKIVPQEGIDVEKEKESLKQDILKYVNELRVITQNVKKNNITLTAEDLEKINSTVDQWVVSAGGIDNFRKSVAAYGLYVHHVVSKFKETYLANKLLTDLAKSVTASEDDMKKYYEQNQAFFTDPEMVKAKHILLMTTDEAGQPYDEQKKKEVKAKAEDILNKIKNGANFDELMKANSQDPGLQSMPDGYTFPKGQMVKEFEDAAFALKVGDVSGLVETTYGYHIIKVEEKIPSKLRTFDEVKESIKAELENNKKQEYVNGLIQKWTSESKIENKI